MYWKFATTTRPQCIVNSAHNASPVRGIVHGRCGGSAGSGVRFFATSGARSHKCCGAQAVSAFEGTGIGGTGNQPMIVWLWARLPWQSLPLRPAARKRREIAEHEARVRCGTALRAVAGAGLAPRRALDDAHGVLLGALLVQPDRSSRRRAMTGQVVPTQPECGKVTCGG
jgi:hypothetical protein